MPLIGDAEWLAMMGERKERVGDDELPPFDFTAYFARIPAADFEGHDCSAGEVNDAYRQCAGESEHVLVSTEDENVFMFLVLDLRRQAVRGHRLLDLVAHYGLGTTRE